MLIKPFQESASHESPHLNDKNEPSEVSAEEIRRWMIEELVVSYRYPRCWVDDRINLVDSSKGNAPTDGFIGFSVLTSAGSPFLWASIQPTGHADLAERLLIEVLLNDPLAGTGIASDGTIEGTKVFRRRFENDKCEMAIDLEAYVNPGSTPSPSPHHVMTGETVSRAARESTLSPLFERVENIFFEAHNSIRDIDGFHDGEAFDEVCKILYCKFYDEEMTSAGQPYRMQRWIYGCAEELAATVRSLYHEANDYDVRVFSLRIPGYERSRGVFGDRIRLSSFAIAKVVETFQDYDFTRSDIDAKGRAFQKMLNSSARTGMGQFFTPSSLVKFMVDATQPEVTDLILDPFCGSGQFLTASLQFVKSREDEGNKSLQEFAFGKLHGIEKSERMARIAMTDMRMHDDGHSNIRCTDALLPFPNYPDLQPDAFDLILTNPPFGSTVSGHVSSHVGPFALLEGRKSAPLEVVGIERCVQFLRPGGRLGIVLPDGILANPSMSYVRNWLDDKLKIRAIVSLPIETFVPFGAGVKTSILFARKWLSGERRPDDYAVFLARIDDVGHDATGRHRDSLDIEHVLKELRSFLLEEGW